MSNNNIFIAVILIFLIGFTIRFLSIYPANTIIGFDQARDLFDATTIFRDFNLRIIGPTAGNNPDLHHGILYLYYIIPPLLIFEGDPFWVTIWNSLFNAATVIIIFLLSRAIFQKNLPALLSSLIVAFSFQFIQFSGWLSNPTVTLFTVPTFFWGLWSYYQQKNWGLIVAAIFLGLSIQFELFFIYLIPVTLIIWIILRIKIPSIKLFLFSISVFALSTFSLIATEIKFNFRGILSLLNAGKLVGEQHLGWVERINSFMTKFFESYSLNLWPQETKYGVLIGISVLTIIFIKLILNYKKKEVRDKFIFLLIYLFSPGIMLFLGFHNAPWFLVGLPPAIALTTGYALSKIRPKLLIIPIIAFFIFQNFQASLSFYNQGQILLEPDRSALLKNQLDAVKYTYKSSEGEKFTVNSLTNPLYINAVWAYHYMWYGKKNYNFLPTWSGGDQIYPYNTLEKFNGEEKYLYLLIDQTPRIPVSHKLSLINWADQRSTLIEEKDFGGTLVQKRKIKDNQDSKTF